MSGELEVKKTEARVGGMRPVFKKKSEKSVLDLPENCLLIFVGTRCRIVDAYNIQNVSNLFRFTSKHRESKSFLGLDGLRQPGVNLMIARYPWTLKKADPFLLKRTDPGGAQYLDFFPSAIRL